MNFISHTKEKFYPYLCILLFFATVCAQVQKRDVALQSSAEKPLPDGNDGTGPNGRYCDRVAENTAADMTVGESAAGKHHADDTHETSVFSGESWGESDSLSQEENQSPPIERMPELVTFVEAEYPVSVYSKGIEGVVLMTLLVNENGGVDSVWIEKGIHPVLDSNALSAAGRFDFKPAIAGGEPVPVYLHYEYLFSLREVARKVEPIGNVGGEVMERGTRKPIPDAMVVISFLGSNDEAAAGLPFDIYRERIGQFEGQYVEGQTLVTTSDSKGRFTFYSVPACSVEVSIPAAGYEMLTDTLWVDAAHEIRIEYYLHKHSSSDYEITVYGKEDKKEISRRQLTLGEIRKIPGLGGDAVKGVQTMPGVNRPRMGSGAVIVRGAPTWDSNYYLDGIALPNLYHFFGLKSVYNSEGLQRTSFYPGGFGVRYGGGIAGVVELTGRQAESDRWHAQTDLSTIDASFLVEGPVNGSISILGSARRSYIGDLANLAMEHIDYEFPFSVSPSYWDYLLRVDYDVTDDFHLFTTFLGSRDSMLFHIPELVSQAGGVYEETDRLGMSIKFHLAMMGADWEISDRLTNTFRYGYIYSTSRLPALATVKTKNESHDHHVRDQLDIRIGEKLSIGAGADLHLLLKDLNQAIPLANDFIRHDTVENWLFGTLGGYTFAEWKPLDGLQIIGGLRYDFFPELNYRGAYLPEYWPNEGTGNKTNISGEPSARLNCRYSITDDHVVKGAIGNYSQTPQPTGHVLMEQWGDPMLPATKASHFVLGYEWQISELVRADIQAYINRQWNIPRLAGPQETESGEITGVRDLWLDDGSGRMRGIELMLRHDRGGRFFGWLAYTLSRSERYNHEKQEYDLYHEDETHHLQLVGSWRLPRLWETGFRLRYVTGKPAAPILEIKESQTYNHFIPVYGQTSSRRMDPFFQIDLRVDKKFVFDKWILSAYLDLQNISWFFYRSPEFELPGWYEKTTVSNIFMPGVGVKAQF